MKKPIPSELEIQLNADVLKALEGKSCHSDIIEPLQTCLSTLKDVNSYCPDGENYSYVVWYVNKIIFAYASGMRQVGVRLSQSGELSLQEAENPKNYKIQNNWYEIPYDSDKLGFLVNSAYDSAKNS